MQHLNLKILNMASSSTSQKSQLLQSLEETVSSGQELVNQITQLSIPGSSKLKRRADKEIKFLKQLTENAIKKEHVGCTNLIHCQAIVDCVLNELKDSSESCSLLNSFSYVDEDVRKRIIVDIVCKHKYRWIKVVARNPKALHLLSLGAGGYGQRSMLDHAVEYQKCANQNPALFKIPQVVFAFVSGITEVLACHLEQQGITVLGERIPIPESIQHLPPHFDNFYMDTTNVPEDNFSAVQQTQRLNLDITAIIAYVSSLTNGNCQLRFSGPVLDQQAEWERERPLKPELDQLFEGKDLYCCEWALKDLQNILNTIGRTREKQNTDELFKRVTVVPDDPSARAMLLQVGGKVTKRSMVIFGTGDTLQAVTVTANIHFIQAAISQGVKFATYVHEARALTEAKEETATPITDI